MSAEDQPQDGRKEQRQGIVPRRGDENPGAAAWLRHSRGPVRVLTRTFTPCNLTLAPTTHNLQPEIRFMTSAIIVAAGKGTRMGPTQDKLFLEIAGKPVVVHTWQRFAEAECIDDIILVVREGMQSAFEELAKRFQLGKPFRLVAGGAERQDSVWNGLEAAGEETEIVAIQDAARPCTSGRLIADTVTMARENGAAVAAQPVTDTIKESVDGKSVTRTLDRSLLWSVQTPQTFRIEILRHALSEARNRGLLITDDTAACELIGQPVRLVTSAEPNPKVTRREDLAYVEMLLSNRVPA